MLATSLNVLAELVDDSNVVLMEPLFSVKCFLLFALTRFSALPRLY